MAEYQSFEDLYEDLNVMCARMWVVAAVVFLLGQPSFVVEKLSSLPMFTASITQSGLYSTQPRILMTFHSCLSLSFLNLQSLAPSVDASSFVFPFSFVQAKYLMKT